MPPSLPWFFVVSLCPGSFPWGCSVVPSTLHVALDISYQHIVHVYTYSEQLKSANTHHRYCLQWYETPCSGRRASNTHHRYCLQWYHAVGGGPPWHDNLMFGHIDVRYILDTATHQGLWVLCVQPRIIQNSVLFLVPLPLLQWHLYIHWCPNSRNICQLSSMSTESVI